MSLDHHQQADNEQQRLDAMDTRVDAQVVVEELQGGEGAMDREVLNSLVSHPNPRPPSGEISSRIRALKSKLPPSIFTEVTEIMIRDYPNFIDRPRVLDALYEDAVFDKMLSRLEDGRNPIRARSEVALALLQSLQSYSYTSKSLQERRQALINRAQRIIDESAVVPNERHPGFKAWLSSPRVNSEDRQAVMADVRDLLRSFDYSQMDGLLSAPLSFDGKSLVFEGAANELDLSSNSGECRTISQKAKYLILEKYPELEGRLQVAYGTEPRYFSQNGHTHVFLTLDLDWIIDPSLGLAGSHEELATGDGRHYSVRGTLEADRFLYDVKISAQHSPPIGRMQDGTLLFLGTQPSIRSISDVGIGFQREGETYADGFAFSDPRVDERLGNDPLRQKVEELRSKIQDAIDNLS